MITQSLFPRSPFVFCLCSLSAFWDCLVCLLTPLLSMNVPFLFSVISSSCFLGTSTLSISSNNLSQLPQNNGSLLSEKIPSVLQKLLPHLLSRNSSFLLLRNIPHFLFFEEHYSPTFCFQGVFLLLSRYRLSAFKQGLHLFSGPVPCLLGVCPPLRFSGSFLQLSWGFTCGSPFLLRNTLSLSMTM